MLSLLFLAGCSSGKGISMMPYEQPQSSPNDFVLCHGFGCSYRQQVKLTSAEWKSVLRPFNKKITNGEQERQAAAEALGLMEKVVTRSSGFIPDRGEAVTFERDQQQMDCIDEAVNTTHYLEFMQEAGVFKYNRVHDPVHRGYFVDMIYPHNAGALEDLATGQVYVMDTYYFDAGHPANVVPLKIWLADWKPDEIIAKRKAEKAAKQR